jgi:hypothetical protein
MTSKEFRARLLEMHDHLSLAECITKKGLSGSDEAQLRRMQVVLHLNKIRKLLGPLTVEVTEDEEL